RRADGPPAKGCPSFSCSRQAQARAGTNLALRAAAATPERGVRARPRRREPRLHDPESRRRARSSSLARPASAAGAPSVGGAPRGRTRRVRGAHLRHRGLVPRHPPRPRAAVPALHERDRRPAELGHVRGRNGRERSLRGAHAALPGGRRALLVGVALRPRRRRAGMAAGGDRPPARSLGDLSLELAELRRALSARLPRDRPPRVRRLSGRGGRRVQLRAHHVALARETFTSASGVEPRDRGGAMKERWRSLVAFLNAPEDPLSLALVRVFACTTVALHFGRFFLSGAADFALVHQEHGGMSTTHGWLEPLGGAEPSLIMALGACCCIAAICGALGLFTRPALVVTWLTVRTLSSLNDEAKGSYDGLFIDTLFVLMLSGAGRTFSLDAPLFPEREGLAPRWPRVLLVAQIGLLYLGSALNKGSLGWLPGG